MPIVFTKPAQPVEGWEDISANNTVPLTISGGWRNAKMWLYPDNNTLLVANGSTSSADSREVATLDLTTMLWASKTDISGSAKLGEPVFHPVNGNPMIMGVTDAERQVYEYSIGTDTWTATLFFSSTRKHFRSPSANLPNGEVILLGSGLSTDGQYNIASRWDGTSLSPAADIPTIPVSTGGNSELFAAGNNKVYMMGNSDADNALIAINNVYIFDTVLNTWDTTSLTMPEPHLQCVVVPLDSTRCMVIGGSETSAGGGSSKTYIFDSNTETFTAYGDGYGMPVSGTPHNTGLNLMQGILLGDGRVLTTQRNGTGTDILIRRTINPV